jgi:hypothetical protein
MAQRVVVWGTGNVGKAALRAVIADPALELAGVIVSQAAKVGRDAGEPRRLPPVGVAASDDVAGVLAKASTWSPTALRGLPSGRGVRRRRARARAGSVVSTALYPFYDPTSAPDDLRRRWRTPVLPAGRRSS